MVKTGASLLIIAEEVNGEALKTINVNISRGTFKVACINAPRFKGVVDKDYLEDLALETGAYCFIKQTGRDLTDASVADLGRAEHVLISKSMTVIVGGAYNDYNQIYTRGQNLSDVIQRTTDSETKEHYKRRYRQLLAHSVVIYAEADTETLTQKRLQSILPLIKNRNERIALDTSSLVGIRLSDEQLQCAKDYYSSLSLKEKCFKDFLSMHEECKSKAQQQLVDMKRKQEEQQAFEKRKIEEEHRLIEKQKEDEIQREKIRSEAYQELEQLQIKKLTLKRELSNLKGLFTKKRRIGIEAVLEEIEKEEQRLKNILQGV